MADRTSRTPGQAAGAWYVDTGCIGCSLCVSTAPETFSMSEDGSLAMVTAQPGTAAGTALAEQALAECPVGAIGNDD